MSGIRLPCPTTFRSPRAASLRLAAAVLALALCADRSSAAVPSCALGYSFYEGAGDHVTQALSAEASVSLPEAEITMAALRYDDDLLDQGVVVIAALGLPVAPTLVFRMLGAGVVGDGEHRAWRAKVGPQLSPSPLAALQISYQRYQDNRDFHSDAVLLESASMLSSRLTARVSASHASTSLGSSSQVSAGLAWVAIPHLELSGDLGLARNGALAGSGPTGSPPLLPVLGPGGNGSPGGSDEVSPTLQLGVRFLFP